MSHYFAVNCILVFSGALTGAINWDLLEKQYCQHNAYKEVVVKMIEFEESAHQAGVDFAQHMDRLAQLEELKQSADRWDHLKTNLNSESNIKSHVFESPPESENLNQFDVPNNLAGSFSMGNQTLSPESSPNKQKSNKFVEMIPKILRNDAKGAGDSLHREAVYFMRGIMDECTHLRNYDVPFDPSLIHIVVAENDGYYLREGMAALPDIWPGAKVQYIQGKGHVSSYLTRQNVFRKAIYDCIDEYVEKYMQHS